MANPLDDSLEPTEQDLEREYYNLHAAAQADLDALPEMDLDFEAGDNEDYDLDDEEGN